MSARLPEFLHRQIKKLAEAEGIPMNQFIATAAAEKILSLKTVDCLKDRADRARRADCDRELAMVSDV
jgi:hypothetical protein